MARMVPTGIDFWASLRSPDLFDPAMIPEETAGRQDNKELSLSISSTRKQRMSVQRAQDSHRTNHFNICSSRESKQFFTDV